MTVNHKYFHRKFSRVLEESNLIGLLTKDTNLVFSATSKLLLMRAKLVRMGSTAITRLCIAATITVYIPDKNRIGPFDLFQSMRKDKVGGVYFVFNVVEVDSTVNS